MLLRYGIKTGSILSDALIFGGLSHVMGATFGVRTATKKFHIVFHGVLGVLHRERGLIQYQRAITHHIAFHGDIARIRRGLPSNVGLDSGGGVNRTVPDTASPDGLADVAVSADSDPPGRWRYPHRPPSVTATRFACHRPPCHRPSCRRRYAAKPLSPRCHHPSQRGSHRRPWGNNPA